MAKISKEEYEILKGLDDQWKWIARDEDLSVYDDKPVKVHSVIPCWDIGTAKNEWQGINRSLFQFIQWEDEEPHNIQELIEEYESGETEVKKDIEWLKEELNYFIKSEVLDEREIGFELAVGEFIDLLNQLDEPEITLNEAFNKLEETHILSKEEIVKHFEQLEIHNGKVTYGDYETLSQEWIDEHARAVAYDGMPDETEIVYVDDLQNLLVPKQEEVDQDYKAGYETGKEHATRDDEPETVASVMADYFGALARIKEVLAMEVEELED